MRIAVITPYYKEPIEKLERCHQSVINQTYPGVSHIMVADGFPRPEISEWDRCMHIPLPICHNDSGDFPRIVGCGSAAAQFYDAIALLDADNWFEPEHIETLVKLQKQSGAHIITCARNLRRPDNGESLGIDIYDSDGKNFNDTNCYLITDLAYPLLAAWGFRDQQLASAISPNGDRLFWKAIRGSSAKLAHSPVATVNYETAYALHYARLGLPMPDFAKVIVFLPEGPKYRLVSYTEYRKLVQTGQTKDLGF